MAQLGFNVRVFPDKCKYFLLSIGVCALLAAPSPAQNTHPPDTPFGVNYVPAHVPDPTEDDATEAFIESAALGGHVCFIWEWTSGDVGYTDASFISNVGKQLGLKVILQLSPTAVGNPAGPPDLPNQSFSDPEFEARYLSDVRKLAALQPDYLLLAPEVNLMYKINRAEFDNFVPLYEEAYSAIKGISPNTKVGISLHMDMFFLYSQFDILNRFKHQDYIGFTTYPYWLISSGLYKTVADIPLWWYGRLKLMIAKPIIFSEVGWPTGGRGNERDQAAFVARLPELMKIVQPELITWTMLHDVPHFRPELLDQEQVQILQGFSVDPAVLFAELNTMGLLQADGPPKAAWQNATQWAASPFFPKTAAH